MIVEKRLILLVLTLRFLFALCNDDAPTSREPTVSLSTRSHYDSEDSTQDLEMFYDFGSTESNFTEIDETTTSYNEFTTEPLTNVFPSISGESSLSTTTITVPDITDSTTINPTICDSSWPVNASADTREVVDLRTDDRGTEWIALSWKSPCNVTNIDIPVIYSIEICDGKNCAPEINETDTKYNATELEPCTQYTFKVKILTESWKSNSGVSLANTTSYDSECTIDLLSI
ncbi:uncharacterized protein LOC118644233 [Monomorium pharaonis]|uniref:uncharacterized protein LOC118644233 n=1 Tax=Monomorium pharaonis TaxID=307658 RepID=UPI001747287E|nr:uncharacterized protein LOC118644233 [Monomorium pharaonis]XP_036150923.1 uncharacterized protein LOC118644233 [Monomorium pharaonis]XP_036150924.1 uncharacterized protein LOC118644233 [Monomorium pharaonis]XP_036150925.1 uncharacterized protein LOC118644233 [Monomorium pharaonis]